MRKLFIILLIALLSACASIENYRSLDQPTDQLLTVSVGGTIFRLNRSSDLPNVVGKADLYGGKIDRGYAELKFLGVNEKGELLLSVTDINKTSSETTMDRYVTKPAVKVDTNIEIGTDSGSDSTRFAFDLLKQKELVIAGVRVVFGDVKPYSISYRLMDTQR